MSDCLMCDVLCKERDEHWDAELAAKAEAASLRANLDVAVEEKRKAEAPLWAVADAARCGNAHAEDDNCPNCRDDVWTKIEPPGNADVRCGACKWFGRGECPRTVSIEPVGERGNIKFFAQATEIAFPCERWETPE